MQRTNYSESKKPMFNDIAVCSTAFCLTWYEHISLQCYDWNAKYLENVIGN